MKLLYILIGHYNPSVRCVLILYISGGTYCLKSTTNDRFFEKLFMVILFTLRVFARNLLRGNRRRNTFRISFWCLAWDSNPGFSSNKPTHYLLDHGDLLYYITAIISHVYMFTNWSFFVPASYVQINFFYEALFLLQLKKKITKNYKTISINCVIVALNLFYIFLIFPDQTNIMTNSLLS